MTLRLEIAFDKATMNRIDRLLKVIEGGSLPSEDVEYVKDQLGDIAKKAGDVMNPPKQ